MEKHEERRVSEYTKDLNIWEVLYSLVVMSILFVALFLSNFGLGYDPIGYKRVTRKEKIVIWFVSWIPVTTKMKNLFLAIINR